MVGVASWCGAACSRRANYFTWCMAAGKFRGRRVDPNGRFRPEADTRAATHGQGAMKLWWLTMSLAVCSLVVAREEGELGASWARSGCRMPTAASMLENRPTPRLFRETAMRTFRTSVLRGRGVSFPVHGAGCLPCLVHPQSRRSAWWRALCSSLHHGPHRRVASVIRQESRRPCRRLSGRKPRTWPAPSGWRFVLSCERRQGLRTSSGPVPSSLPGCL